MKRKLMIVFLLICLAAAGGIWFVFLRKPPSEAAAPAKSGQPPLVKVEAIQMGPIARTLELSGEVVATRRVVISALKEGPIAYCPWREGDSVKAGETLVRIERETLRAEAASAQAALETSRARLDDLFAGTRPEEIEKAAANLKRAEAVLAEARRNYERQAELIKTSVASQEAVDKARERLDIAEADISAMRETLSMLKAGPTETTLAIQKAVVGEAEARLTQARAHLAECEIAAPFDGIIANVHVRPGDMAAVRSPLLEMYDPDSLALRFAVPESQAGSVSVDMPVELSLDALPGRKYSARITRVYPDLHPVMRTRMVEATLSDAAQVAPNMFARISLTLAREEKALVVPSDAIALSATGQRTLFVIENDKAVRRTVTTGIEQGLRVQILSGVKPGEKVVVAGHETLKPNMPVRLAGASGAKDKKPGAQSEGSRAGGQSE